MNWYEKYQVTDRGNLSESGGNEHIRRVLAPPNSITDWGKEKKIDDWGFGETWQGQFGTRRYIRRNEDGDIVSAILIGRKKSGQWQEIMFYTDPDYRNQGIATTLYEKALQDVGKLNKASEYSDLGLSFALKMREKNPDYFSQSKEEKTPSQ